METTERLCDSTPPGDVGQRSSGELVSDGHGKGEALALFGQEDHGQLFLGHDAEGYEGKIIGKHGRSNALTVDCLTG
ncbi:hypothetical protein CDT93_21815, partial [Cronobacter sakazakii]